MTALASGGWSSGSAPPLVCPACRRVEGGRLWYSRLEPHPVGLSCPGCALLHPVVDGVPIVLSDPDAWLKQEGPVVFARRDLPADLRERLLSGVGGALARDERLLRSYSDPLPCPLREVLDQELAQMPGLHLELGAGLGLGAGAEARVALDLNFSLLRLHPGLGLVADAADPPFEAEQFDGVLLLNLLDSCADPRVVLAQADALLRPGGQLLISVPWAWSDEVTPPARRFSSAQLRAGLAGDVRALRLRLSYTLLSHHEDLIWRLRVGPRAIQEHPSEVLRLQKRSETG